MSRELVQSALQFLTTILGDAGFKATVVFAIALVICLFLRKASAAVKHRIWSLAFCVALVLPLGSAFIPQWRIPLLPAFEASRSAAVLISDVTSSRAAHLPVGDSSVTHAESKTARSSVDRADGEATAVNVAAPTAAMNEMPITRAPLTAIEVPVVPLSDSDSVQSKSVTFTSLTTPLVSLWLIGFLFVFAPLMIGVAWLQRLLSSAKPLTDIDATSLVDDQAKRLGLMRRVAVVETDDSFVPMTTGVLRPFVVLPFDWRQWTKSRLRFVLLHELAHIQRLDVLYQAIGRIACGLYWFNPLSWYALHRLRVEREFACDDCVVRVADKASAYANELLEIAQSYRESRLAVGIAMTRGSVLEQRIVSMFDENRSHQPVSRSMAVLLGTVTLFVALAFLFVTLGQSTASEPQSASESQPAAKGKVAQQSNADKPDDSATTQSEKPAANQNSTDKEESQSKAKKKDLTRVFVGGPDRKPVDKAEIYWIRSRVHDLSPMKPQLVATTDASGKAVFEAPWKTPADKNQPASWEYWDRIVVKAKGFGWEYTSPESMSSSTNGPGAFLSTLFASAGHAIGLPAAGPSIRGQIFDIEGQPVSGATIRVRWFDSNGIEDVTNPKFYDRAQGVRDVIEPEPLRHILSSAITDSKGHFEIVDLPKNCLVDLLVQGDTIESTGLIAFNGSENDIAIPQGARRDQKEFKVHGRNLRMVVGPSKPLEGQVVDLDTGSPIADAVVRAFSIHGVNLYSSREREEFSARTDNSGRFRITGLPLGDDNRLAAFTTGDVPYIPIGHRVDTNGPESIIRQEFRLKKGVWAEGRVCDAESNEPFTGEIVYYSFINQEIEKSIPGFRDAYVDGRYWTNANGEFRVPVAPIRGILAFRYNGHYQATDPMIRYPRGYGSESIGGAEKIGALGSYPTIPFYLIPSNYHRVAEVHPAEGEKTVQIDMSLRASKPVSIAVVDPAGKPVTGYEVYGAAENWGWQKEDTSQFNVGDLKPGEERKIFVFHRQRNLAGGAVVTSPTEEVVKIQLDKAGSISGRLVDEDDEPLKDATVFVDFEGLLNRKDTAIWANGLKLIYNPTNIPTDQNGRFVVDGLIPGWKYSAHVSAKRNVGGKIMDQGVGNPFKDATIEPGENKDLGTIKLAPQK